MKHQKVCCFTGHRILPRNSIEEIAQTLYTELEALEKKGISHFLCGGAIGFDMLAGEAVLRLKASYPRVHLEMILPCANQSARFSNSDQKRYTELIQQADHVLCLNDTYLPGCMYERNRHMVNHSDICVAYLAKPRGGTWYTVNRAQEKGIPVLNLYEACQHQPNR